ncbi:MAG: anthranilate phosphoribosyltransferase [Desulfobacteraceae bacterium]|jgi:anthranilate phosphoribosyltransferase|nr:anthranilate phosphoribosyltransferase [Desulfobacteraceae bacterium]
MQTQLDRQFGTMIMRLIKKEDLSRNEARDAFFTILEDRTTEMQQGAFLSALTAKGETEDEVAGAWEAIYELDTERVSLNGQTPLFENSGTGMDTFKTFNISTAASIVAASGGIRMARHGARAITSVCGTVDMAEALGVDVECDADVVAESIEKVGIGLFNGMSPRIHPKALGRILSKTFFGTTLNIAASLANPALPKMGLRGVYAKEMILPVIKAMKAIGYRRALVLYGGIDGSDKGMDEASVCGTTYCAELSENGEICEFTFRPEQYGLSCHNPADLSPVNDIRHEAKRFVALIRGNSRGARTDATLLNAGLIFYLAAKAGNIGLGIEKAANALFSGLAYNTLEKWVETQNMDPETGLKRLEGLA